MTNNIATLRKQKGLTQDELSELCQISQTELSLVENKKINPSRTVLVKLAAALNCSIDDLIPFDNYSANIIRQAHSLKGYIESPVHFKDDIIINIKDKNYCINKLIEIQDLSGLDLYLIKALTFDYELNKRYLYDFLNIITGDTCDD